MGEEKMHRTEDSEQGKEMSEFMDRRSPKQNQQSHSHHAKRRGHPQLLFSDQAMWKLLLTFLVPMLLSNVLQSLGGTVSMIILGKGLGEKALAAASSVMPLIFFLISLVIGLGSASSILIGQAYGGKQMERLKAVVETSLKFSFLLGLMMAVIGLLFTRELLELVKVPVGVLPLAIEYAEIMFAFLPLQFVYISYTTFLRGTSDSQTPFYFLLISTILAIALSPVLAFGWLGLPALQMRGIALGNVLATLLTLVILFVYLYRKKHILAPDFSVFRSLKMDRQILKMMVKIGIPTGVQMVFVSLSVIAVVSFVNRFGEQAAASFGAVSQVISYVQMPAVSLGMATGIFGSQLIGGGQTGRLRELMRSAVKINYWLGGSLVVITYLLSHHILSLFLMEKSSLTLAQNMLFMVLWAYLLFGNSTVISGMMRSSGTVFWPTLLGIASIWMVQVPLAYLLSQNIGLEGIFLAYPIAFTVSLLGQYIYYRFFWKKKRHKNLFSNHPAPNQ
jgi:putative MATE family efflux protein